VLALTTALALRLSRILRRGGGPVGGAKKIRRLRACGEAPPPPVSLTEPAMNWTLTSFEETGDEVAGERERSFASRAARMAVHDEIPGGAVEAELWPGRR